MKEESKTLLEPSPDLLKNVVGKINKSTDRKLKIAKPVPLSSCPFKMIFFLGVLLLITLATRITNTRIHDTAIVGIGLLLVAIAGFLFPMALNFAKNRKNL